MKQTQDWQLRADSTVETSALAFQHRIATPEPVAVQVATQLLQGFPTPNGVLTGAVASDVPMPAASTASLASSLCSDGAFPAYTRIIHFSFNLDAPRLGGSKRSPGRPPPEGLESDKSFP